MPRIKITVEYDGTEYSGWQLQKKDKTIQGEIESALKTIYKKRIIITASGRTDAGVHARNQVAHFDLPDFDESWDMDDALFKLKKSLNGLVNKDIVIKKLELCRSEFHARYDAKSRIYRYFITQIPTSVNKNFSWYISYPLNFTLMQEAADEILNLKDFNSFCKTGSSNKTTLCSIKKSQWFKRSDMWIYEIEANRFLYGMVRAIVGTLVALGQGKIKYDQFLNIIDPGYADGVSYLAPAQGLFLEKINY
jgi:tRNA pseudouridine38-40 synthase